MLQEVLTVVVTKDCPLHFLQNKRLKLIFWAYYNLLSNYSVCILPNFSKWMYYH